MFVYASLARLGYLVDGSEHLIGPLLSASSHTLIVGMNIVIRDKILMCLEECPEVRPVYNLWEGLVERLNFLD